MQVGMLIGEMDQTFEANVAMARTIVAAFIPLIADYK
jgi:hypothetical protein